MPEYQLGQAGGHLNRGLALATAGRTAEAEAANRAAIALLQALADGHPHVGDYRLALAKAWTNQGVLLAESRRAEARTARKTALDILKRLADGVPASSNTAGPWPGPTAISAPCWPTGRPSSLRHGTLFERIACSPARSWRRPTRTCPRSRPSWPTPTTTSVRPTCSARPTRFTHAKRSLEIRQQLAARFPDVPEYAAAEARALTNLGALHMALGQAKEADQSLSRARDTWERLTREYPAVVEYRHDYAAHHLNRGILAHASGRPGHGRGSVLRRPRPVGRAEPGAAGGPAVQGATRPRGQPVRRSTGRRARPTRPTWPPPRPPTGRPSPRGRSWRRPIPDVGRYPLAIGGASYGLGSLNAMNRLKPADALPWYDKAVAALRPLTERDGMTRRPAKLHLALFGRAVALGLQKEEERGGPEGLGQGAQGGDRGEPHEHTDGPGQHPGDLC